MFINVQNLTSITGHARKVGLTARISVALSYRRRDFPNFFLDPDYSNVPNLNFRFDGQQRQLRLVGQLFFGQPQHFRFRLLRLGRLQPRLANPVEVLGVVKIVGNAEIKIEKKYEIPEYFFSHIIAPNPKLVEFKERPCLKVVFFFMSARKN
jgi:hypothetical protein